MQGLVMLCHSSLVTRKGSPEILAVPVFCLKIPFSPRVFYLEKISLELYI